MSGFGRCIVEWIDCLVFLLLLRIVFFIFVFFLVFLMVIVGLRFCLRVRVFRMWGRLSYFLSFFLIYVIGEDLLDLEVRVSFWNFMELILNFI